jgi:transposase-like protein
MSKTRRRQHSSIFKAKVALDAIKERETLGELSSRHGVHANQIRQWKQQLSGNASALFERTSSGDRSQEQLISSLYEQIGQLQVELTWLKKRV